jgi:hypothetical protein
MSKIYGYVDKVSFKGHAYVVAADGASYLALSSNVVENEVGQRFFVEGEEVDFDPMENTRGPRSLAINITPRNREHICRKDYRETATLISWDGTKGAARRPIGQDQLWVEVQNISTLGVETLKPGSQIYCRVAPPLKPGQRWRALDCEIVIMETEEEVATDVEPNATA